MFSKVIKLHRSNLHSQILYLQVELLEYLSSSWVHQIQFSPKFEPHQFVFACQHTPFLCSLSVCLCLWAIWPNNRSLTHKLLSLQLVPPGAPPCHVRHHSHVPSWSVWTEMTVDVVNHETIDQSPEGSNLFDSLSVVWNLWIFAFCTCEILDQGCQSFDPSTSLVLHLSSRLSWCPHQSLASKGTCWF